MPPPAMTDDKDPKADEKPVGAVPPIRRRRVIKTAETGVEAPPEPLEPIRVEEKTDGRKLLDARGPRMDFRRRDTRGPRRDDRGRGRRNDRPRFDDAPRSDAPRSDAPSAPVREERQRNDRAESQARSGDLGLPMRPKRGDASERAVREEMMRGGGESSRPARSRDPENREVRSRSDASASARASVEAPVTPPEPEAIDLGKELALIAAPPVSVKGPRKEKPKTAKEAMRARVEAQRSQDQRRRETKVERSGPASKRAKGEGPSEREADAEARDSSPPSSSERAPEPRPGLWQRFLGLFRSKR